MNDANLQNNYNVNIVKEVLIRSIENIVKHNKT